MQACFAVLLTAFVMLIFLAAVLIVPVFFLADDGRGKILYSGNSPW